MLQVLECDYGRTLQGLADGRVAFHEEVTRNTCRWAVEQIKQISKQRDQLLEERKAAYGLAEEAKKEDEDVVALIKDVADVATVLQLIRPVATATEYINHALNMAMVPMGVDHLQDIREHHAAITESALRREKARG